MGKTRTGPSPLSDKIRTAPPKFSLPSTQKGLLPRTRDGKHDISLSIPYSSTMKRKVAALEKVDADL